MASLFSMKPRDKELSEGLTQLFLQSCWAKHHYSVHVSVYDVLESLQRYSNQDSLPAMTPPWQRDNDKWTRAMQVAYVENILLGFKDSVISLYTLDPESLRGCKLLDGLQRSTALLAFLNDEFSVLDDWAKANNHPPLFYSTLRDSTGFVGDQKLVRFNIYRFRSESEAIDFYCQMNENITHSSADLAKARTYQATLK